MENINGFVESIDVREDMSTGKNATLIASTPQISNRGRLLLK